MKRISTFFLLALLVAVAGQSQTRTSAQPAPKAPDPQPKIVATINGETLTQDKFEQLWQALSPEMRANYDQNAGGKIGFLDNYIERRLIIQQAMKENFDKRKDVAFDLEQARDTTLFDRYVKIQIASEVISEADLRAYYDEHKKDFSKPAKAKARHIVVTPMLQPVLNSTEDDAKTPEEAEKKINMLRMQLAKDHSISAFADLASKYSEDLSAKSGGDLGWVSKGKLSPALDDALFNKLEPGQISDVLKTEYGYHIVLCEAKQPAAVAAFSEVRDEILQMVLKDRQADIIAVTKALTQDLRRISSVAVYRENL